MSTIEILQKGKVIRVPKQLIDVVDHINNNLEKNLTVDELAELTFWGKAHFSRNFKKFFGTTIHQFILEKKVEKLIEVIVNSNQNLSQISKSYGFNSYSNFFHAFKKYTNYTPQEYRILYTSKSI